MSISVQDSQGINNINPTQDLQKGTSLHGRAYHKITDGGKYIIQSINNIAQSVLSTCIRVVSFGRYNLDSLKSYLFSNQTALGNDASSSNLSMRSAPPPPPPLPTPNDLNRASSTKVQSFQGSADGRSSFNPTKQDSPGEDGYILEGGTDSRRSSLHGDSNFIMEEQSISSNVHSQKEKDGNQKRAAGLFAGVQENKLFQKVKNKLAHNI